MGTVSNRKTYILTLSSNFGRILLVSIIGMITVPISLNYWKADRYGTWLLINSVLVYLSATNLGLNSAAAILINKNSNELEKLRILKKAFLLIILSAGLIFSFLAFLNFRYSNWIGILGEIPSDIFAETQETCIILMSFFLLNLPFSLITSAINGFYKPYIENFFKMMNSIFIFLALLINIKLQGNLIMFAVLIGISNLIVNICRSVYFYAFIYRKTNRVDEDTLNVESNYRNIMITGLRCFGGSIASMVVLNTDNFVIARFLGVGQVTAYAVTFKLFTLLFNLIFILNSSVVPLVGRNIGQGKIEDTQKLYLRTFYLITWIGGGMWIGGVAFFKSFILVWSGVEGYAGLMALFFLGAYSYVFSIANLNYVMINTFNYIKGLVWFVWIEAIINLSVSIILSQYWGLGGIAFGTFVGTILSPMIVFPLILKKRSEGKILMDKAFLVKHGLLILMPALALSLLIHAFVVNIFANLAMTILLLLIYSLGCSIILPVEIKTFFKQKQKRMMMRLMSSSE